MTWGVGLTHIEIRRVMTCGAEGKPLEGVGGRTNELGGTQLLSAEVTGRCGNGTVLGSRNARRSVEEPCAGEPHARFCEGVAPRKSQGRLYSTLYEDYDK